MKLEFLFFFFHIVLIVASSDTSPARTSDQYFKTMLELLTDEKHRRRQLEQELRTLKEECFDVKEKVSLTGEISQLKSELESLKMHNSAFRESLSSIVADVTLLKAKLEAQSSELISFKNNILSGMAVIENHDKFSNQSIALLQTELSIARVEIAEMKQTSSKYRKEISRNITDILSSVFDLQNHDELSNQSIALLETEVIIARGDIADVKQKSSKYRNEISRNFTNIFSTVFNLENRDTSLNQSVQLLKEDVTIVKKDALDSKQKSSKCETEMTRHLGRFNRINTTLDSLQRQITDNDRKVALTACYASISGRIVKFGNVRSSIGVTNLSSFKSSGKFTCEHLGLYHISATLMSKANNDQFNIYKNGYWIAEAYTSQHSPTQSYHSSTVVGAVELDVGDTVHIDTENDLASVFNLYSCLTIIKVN